MSSYWESRKSSRVLNRPKPASETSADYMTLLGAGTIDDDPERQMEYFARRRFPDDPNAISRYMIVNGRVMYQGDDGNMYPEIPDAMESVGSFLKNVTYATPDALASAPALATGIATAPMMMAGGVAPALGATALASAGGQYAKEYVGNLLAGDPINHSRVASNVAFDVAGEGVGGLLARRAANRTFVGQFGDPMGPKAYASPNNDPGVFQSDVRNYLDAGQRFDNEGMTALADAARQHPASRGVMRAADEARTEVIESEVGRFMREISGVDDLDTIGRIAIDTADKGARKLASDMAAKASPHYRNAFDSGAVVDLSQPDGVLDYVTAQIAGGRNLKENTHLLSQYRKVWNLLHGKDGKALSDVESLHFVKREIDHMLDKTQPQYVGRSMEGFLTGVKNRLLGAMDAASPDYAKARQIYIDNYPERTAGEQVDAILSRIKDQKLHKAAVSLFNDASPTSIRQARQLFEVADPSGEAWGAVVRGMLQHNFETAGKEFATGNRSLIGAKFASRVFGTAFLRRNMKEALTDQQYKGLENLVEDLRRSALGVPDNSATARRTEAFAEMERRGTNLMTKVADRVDLQNPLKALPGAVNKLNRGEGWKELAEAIASPEGRKALETIAGLPSNSVQRKVAMAQIIASVVADEADASAEESMNLLQGQ